jgi:short-subunit dehydrogenase
MNILIAGATSGIGKALWQHYVSENNNVAIIGRRTELLNAIKAEAPTYTFPYEADIADISSLNHTFDEILKELHSLDLVIVCAGIGELNPKLNIDTELLTIATNVVGWTNILDRSYSLLEQQDYGHLVTITSVGGLQPTPIAPSYSASKAFQINYTKSLQAKAKNTNIKITEIRPGLVDTRMAKGEGLFWVMPLSKVVPQIIKAINRKQKMCIVTKRWRILNYLLRHFV